MVWGEHSVPAVVSVLMGMYVLESIIKPCMALIIDFQLGETRFQDKTIRKYMGLVNMEQLTFWGDRKFCFYGNV